MVMLGQVNTTPVKGVAGSRGGGGEKQGIMAAPQMAVQGRASHPVLGTLGTKLGDIVPPQGSIDIPGTETLSLLRGRSIYQERRHCPSSGVDRYTRNGDIVPPQRDIVTPGTTQTLPEESTLECLHPRECLIEPCISTENHSEKVRAGKSSWPWPVAFSV